MSAQFDSQRTFEKPSDFALWLAQNHNTAPELWVKIYKKSAQQPSITWEEAVMEALCWGWIDGIKKSLDDAAYLQRFTPRRKGSLWSRVNTQHVERLIAEKRMQAPGMQTVQEAQSNGNWERAYASMRDMTIPEDFLRALEAIPNGKSVFEALSRQHKYQIYFGLHTAKMAKTREKRKNTFLNQIAEAANNQQS